MATVVNDGTSGPRPMENPIDLSDVPVISFPFPHGLPGWDLVVRSSDGKTVYARAPAGFAIVMIFHSRFGHPIFPMLAMKLREQVATGRVREATTSLRAVGLALERREEEEGPDDGVARPPDHRAVQADEAPGLEGAEEQDRLGTVTAEGDVGEEAAEDTAGEAAERHRAADHRRSGGVEEVDAAGRH